MRFLFLLVVCAFPLTTQIGCDGGVVTPTNEAVTPPAAPTPKEQLLKVAETGEGGSGLDMIRSELADKGEAGDAKAKAAAAEVEELMKISDPAAIKKKAKEIADKL